jgi:hypothetical protein
MKKVYIICEPTRFQNGVEVKSVDLTPTTLWGEPVVLLPNMQSLISPESTVATLREKLATFDDSDFLVPIGDPVLMCLAATVASDVNNGRVAYLKWDRKLSAYVPIHAAI